MGRLRAGSGAGVIGGAGAVWAGTLENRAASGAALWGIGVTTLGWGFALFALAEVSYMTYHLNWTTFLFAHTISEVLDLGAFALVFVAVSRTLLNRSAAGLRA